MAKRLYNAGRRNERVTFQTKTVTSDAIGGGAVAWQDWGTRWASKSVRGGGQEGALAGSQAVSSLKVRFVVIYESALYSALTQGTMRLIYRSQVVDIERAFDVDDRRQSIEIHGVLRGVNG